MTSSIYTCMTSFIYTYMISSIYTNDVIHIIIWRHCNDLVIYLRGAHQIFHGGYPNKFHQVHMSRDTRWRHPFEATPTLFWGFIFAFEGLRVLTHALHCACLQHATLARVAMATRYTELLSEIPPSIMHHAWLTLFIGSRLQYRCIDFCGQNWHFNLLL